MVRGFVTNNSESLRVREEGASGLRQLCATPWRACECWPGVSVRVGYHENACGGGLGAHRRACRSAFCAWRSLRARLAQVCTCVLCGRKCLQALRGDKTCARSPSTFSAYVAVLPLAHPNEATRDPALGMTEKRRKDR